MTIRPAMAGDYEVVTTLSRDLGVDDPPADRERWLRDLAPETLVCERAGEVIGYVNHYRLDDAGYVRNLVVAASARNEGVGRDLMHAAASRLAAVGTREWHLNVKADNAPAIRLYERLGMRALYCSAVLRVRWDLAFPDEPFAVIASSIAPEEDAEIERTFGLLSGRLASARMRPGRVLLQLREGSAVAGVAVFDPRFPGAAPFRVARPTLAAALVRALRPHAPGGDEFQLVIDNDEPLVAALVAAGAGVKFRLVHYAGPIPDAAT